VQESFDASLPTVLRAAWNISELDVEKTLRHVCDKVYMCEKWIFL